VTYEMGNKGVQTVFHNKDVRIETSHGIYNDRRDCKCGSLNIDASCTGTGNSAPYISSGPEQYAYIDSLFEPLRAGGKDMTLSTTEQYLAMRNSR
jgi:hypothetical protein